MVAVARKNVATISYMRNDSIVIVFGELFEFWVGWQSCLWENKICVFSRDLKTVDISQTSEGVTELLEAISYDCFVADNEWA